MTSDARKMKTIAGRGRRRRRGEFLGVWAVGLMVWFVAAGCASGPPSEAEQAYERALDRMVRGYVHPMSCQALLPMAEQLLWEEGYRQVTQFGDRDGVRTEWDGAQGPAHRYEVHTRRVSPQRCAVEFLYVEGQGVDQREQRVERRELELLEMIDEREAQRIRSRARRQAGLEE